jgi:hypothetical protein
MSGRCNNTMQTNNLKRQRLSIEPRKDRKELIPAALSDWMLGDLVTVEGTVGSDVKSFARRSSVILSSSCAAASSSMIGLFT